MRLSQMISREYKGYIFQPILDMDLDEVMMKINNDTENEDIKNKVKRYCAYRFLKAAETMQEQYVVHRDLKLSNMMLNSNDVFIVDGYS